MRLARERLTIAEVAARMGCAPGTVSAYWQRIFGKTGARGWREVLALIGGNNDAATCP